MSIFSEYNEEFIKCILCFPRPQGNQYLNDISLKISKKNMREFNKDNSMAYSKSGSMISFSSEKSEGILNLEEYEKANGVNLGEQVVIFQYFYKKFYVPISNKAMEKFSNSMQSGIEIKATDFLPTTFIEFEQAELLRMQKAFEAKIFKDVKFIDESGKNFKI